MDRPTDLSAALSGLAVEQCRTRPSEELLEQFLRERDPAAFRALVERHGGAVLRACRAVLRRRDDLAGDAFQETFRKLAQKGDMVRRASPVGAWLAVTARRTALSLRRGEERRMRHERQAAETSRRPPAPPADDDPARREEAAAVQAALATLPERYRLPLELVYLDGLTHAEAALALGCPKGTVDSAVSRGLGKLRAALARTAPAAAAGAVGVEALLAGQAQALSRDLVAGVVRLALATAAEPVLPLAVLAGWPRRAAVVVVAAALGGVGLALLPPAPAPPVDAPLKLPAEEPLADRNCRVLRDEVAPRMIEALRPLALNGGDITVTRVEAFDCRVWMELEVRHKTPLFGAKITRARFYLNTADGGTAINLDARGTGEFQSLTLEKPIILFRHTGLNIEVTARPEPFVRALAILRAFPPDRRAQGVYDQHGAEVRAAITPYLGVWLFRGNPAQRNFASVNGDGTIGWPSSPGSILLPPGGFVIHPDGRVRVWWSDNWYRLTDGGRKLVLEGTDAWWAREP
jgi:RNA polymerase sigma factor (sigma-70 family)